MGLILGLYKYTGWFNSIGQSEQLLIFFFRVTARDIYFCQIATTSTAAVATRKRSKETISEFK